ncbi:MAG TPA: class I SAM-dependent methyltransferase [Phycisphaerae bacterium]|nr:class I SAM-dependent methyltransferase [Phycisphaerae bacterium]HRW52289.1 class I SAM-dependent methyltransferase [Phycisphaerae bacterium]
MQDILIATEAQKRGLDRRIGERHYRAYVGPAESYDATASNQFNVLCQSGLREEHAVLDIGCGSLGAGRLLMAFLLPGRYFGIEPERWLVEGGIREELGREFVRMKQPTFDYNAEFNLGVFRRQFDFLLAHSIFAHTPKNVLEKCFAEGRRVLKPDGLFVATFMEGELDYEGDRWIYPDQARYTAEYIDAAAGRAGLLCNFPTWTQPTGQRWFVLHHPDHSPNLGPSPA